jgi:FMN reductase (NADPH)/FMN reductase [NAD(P)H]
MNPTLEVIEKRKSVRTYTAEALTKEERDAILRAAFRAPTSGAMMLYSIIEIEDQAIKERLVEICPQQSFIAKTPYLLLFLADYQRWMDIYAYSGVEARCRELGIPFRSPQAGDLMLACSDALVAAQTAVIAAESMGVGSCYISDILKQYELHQELFALPRYVLPITMVSFGHPASPKGARKQLPRFGRRFITHTNRYKRISQEEVGEMFQLFGEQSGAGRQPASDTEKFVQENYLHKFNTTLMSEMNRSVNEMLKNWA